jgi:hypothetical protein
MALIFHGCRNTSHLGSSNRLSIYCYKKNSNPDTNYIDRGIAESLLQQDHLESLSPVLKLQCRARSLSRRRGSHSDACCCIIKSITGNFIVDIALPGNHHNYASQMLHSTVESSNSSASSQPKKQELHYLCVVIPAA